MSSVIAIGVSSTFLAVTVAVVVVVTGVVVVAAGGLFAEMVRGLIPTIGVLCTFSFGFYSGGFFCVYVCGYIGGYIDGYGVVVFLTAGAGCSFFGSCFGVTYGVVLLCSLAALLPAFFVFGLFLTTKLSEVNPSILTYS